MQKRVLEKHREHAADDENHYHCPWEVLYPCTYTAQDYRAGCEAQSTQRQTCSSGARVVRKLLAGCAGSS